MAQERKSESVVTVNAKLSSYNLMALNFRGATEIPEGRLVIPDPTTGIARAVDETDKIAYMNFLASTAPSVQDYQADYFDSQSPVQPLPAGGLSGIAGSGIELGLEKYLWFNYGTDDPTPQKYVLAADTGHGSYTAADAGKVWAQATPGVGAFTFGVITRVKGNTVFFMFSSIGEVH